MEGDQKVSFDGKVWFGLFGTKGHPKQRLKDYLTSAGKGCPAGSTSSFRRSDLSP